MTYLVYIFGCFGDPLGIGVYKVVSKPYTPVRFYEIPRSILS